MQRVADGRRATAPYLYRTAASVHRGGWGSLPAAGMAAASARHTSGSATACKRERKDERDRSGRFVNRRREAGAYLLLWGHPTAPGLPFAFPCCLSMESNKC